METKFPAGSTAQISSAQNTWLDFAHTDWQAFNNHVWQLPLLDAVQNAQTVDEAWSLWRTALEDSVSLFVPVVRRSTFPSNKPWYSAVHHRQRRLRDRLFAKAKRLGSTDSWIAYRLSRNCLTSLLRKAKRHYHERMARDMAQHHGTRTWWRKAKILCNVNRPSPVIPDLYHDNQAYPATSNTEKTNLLAKVFASYSQAPLLTPDLHSAGILTPTSTVKFSIQPFSVQSVFDTLSRLPIQRKTAGLLNNRILRETAEVTSQSLSALFNRCLLSRTQPREWKSAVVVPVFKGKGNPSHPVNYRPISLLNAVAKLYESMISRQFYSFVESHKIISSSQFGFCRKRSTVDQLVQLTSIVSRAFDSKSSCDQLFLDFSKAFDRVSHHLVIQSVSGWCSLSACSWVKDFISDRSIRVRIGQTLSDPLPITAGVPQGSHLGPLLFNLCINSFPDAPASSTLSLFADDSNLILVSPANTSLPIHHALLQTDIDKCCQWSSATAMTFNTSKCVHLPFQKYALAPGPSSPLIMNGVPIQKGDSHCHLGVTITPSLNFSDHIKSITHKFRSRVFLLRHMAHFLSASTVSLLYKCYVRPLLEYAVPVWSFAVSHSDSLTLDRLQAVAARSYLLCKTRHPPEWETPKQILNRTCDWSSLKWRRQILSLLYFHHVFYQFPSLLIRFKFNVSLSCRHPSSIVLPRSGAHFLKSPLFSLSVEWNKLPEHIRCVQSSVNFRIALKAHYSQHRYSLTGIPNFSV